MRPVFFETPDDFRAWLAEHHATAAEVLVGFYKKGSGRPSITSPESVDEALCFGWNDVILGEEFERLFRADDPAWVYFQQQPASYRRTVIWWVLSAKKEETKRNR